VADRRAFLDGLFVDDGSGSSFLCHGGD
jgi:hypothetical protein